MRRKGQTNLYAVSLTALIFGVGSYLVALSLGSQAGGASSSGSRLDSAAASPDTILVGESDLRLSPRGVVTEQMKALNNCRANRDAVARVFAFASPKNKAITGPLERFERMVWSDPFRALIVCNAWTAGKAITHEDAAVVLVSVIRPDGKIFACRFYLSRQDEDLQERWMTDAVIPLAQPASNEQTKSDTHPNA